MLKLGVIGCGRIVEFAHVDTLTKLSGEVEVSALADASLARLEAVGGKLGDAPQHRYADYREMVRKESLDFVDIAVPPFLHEEVAVHCARAGVHVIMEKPIATSLGEVDRMLEAVEASGIVFCSDGAEARKNLEVVLAAYESSATGEVVELH